MPGRARVVVPVNPATVCLLTSALFLHTVFVEKGIVSQTILNQRKKPLIQEKTV